MIAFLVQRILQRCCRVLLRLKRGLKLKFLRARECVRPWSYRDCDEPETGLKWSVFACADFSRRLWATLSELFFLQEGKVSGAVCFLEERWHECIAQSFQRCLSPLRISHGCICVCVLKYRVDAYAYVFCVCLCACVHVCCVRVVAHAFVSCVCARVHVRYWGSHAYSVHFSLYRNGMMPT